MDIQSNIEIIDFTGGCGSDAKNAVIVSGARSFRSGINAIFEFISASISNDNIELIIGEPFVFTDSVIHKVEVFTSKGNKNTFFFNVTEFNNSFGEEDAAFCGVFRAIN